MNDTYPLRNPWGIAGFQPWYYFRYAEILVNFAEAANEASALMPHLPGLRLQYVQR